MSFRIMAPMMSIGGLPAAASRWRNNAPPRGFVQVGHGRHVERFAQKRMADLREPWFGMDAAAGFMPTGGESGAGGLSGVVEALRMNAEGQQRRNGLFADARDRVEQVTLVLHLRGAVNVLANGGDQGIDLFIETVDVLGNSAANRLSGDIEAIAFLNPRGAQGIQARHQRLQRLLAGRRCLPGFRLAFGAEAGDQPASPASVLPRFGQDWAKDLI
jgi:hypothetical protein